MAWDGILPERWQSWKHYHYLRDGLRVLQFIFAIVNIGLFAAYIVRTSIRISSSSGAVIGILSIAAAFSVISTVVNCTRLGAKWRVTIILFVFDLLFIGAFIAVSVLTARARSRPAGTGGRCSAPAMRVPVGGDNDNDNEDVDRSGCYLTSGSLALSILSAISHAASSVLGQGKQTARAGKVEIPFTGSN